MERKDHIDAFGAASLIGFSALLGLNQVMIKVVNSGLQPVFQAGLRSLVALPVLLLFAIWMRRKISVSDGSLLPGLISGLFFTGEFVMLFVALDYTSVARASIFFYTMPFWVAVGAHFLIPGERLTSKRTTGLLLAIVGVILALSQNETPATAYAFIGDALCLIGAMMWAAIALTARLSKLNRSAPEMQLIYQLAVSGPVMILLAFSFGPFIRDIEPHHWIIFSFQAVFVVAAGFTFWFWLLSKYPASDMASFGFLAPVFGVGFGWLVLSEEIGLRLVAALLLVGVGIVLVNRKPKVRPD